MSPHALKRIFETHPTIDISIAVGSSDVLLEDVLNRRLDFAVCRIPSGMNPLWFDYLPVGQETLRVIVAVDHPLGQACRHRGRPQAPKLGAPTAWLVPSPGHR